MRTTKQTLVSAAFGLLLLASPALGEETCRLGGMWRLVSFHSEDVVTKARINVYGERPWGYLRIQCDGQFSAWAASRNFVKAENDIQPNPSHLATYYSGTYHLAANRIIMRIANARHEGWIAYDAGSLVWTEGPAQTDEARSFQVLRNDLGYEIVLIETAPMPNPNGYGNSIIGRTVWERVFDWEYAPPN